MRIYLVDASLGNFTLANQGMAKNEAAPFHRIPRILLSYHYLKTKRLDEVLAKYFTRPYPEVFLDSGAFSAFSQGVKIDISAYCEYIHHFKPYITAYSNLDVIGSASGTLANQRKMELNTLSPLPVFHVGEAWKYLEDYISQYAYIALGGMVPYMFTARKILMPWLVRCFKMAQGKSVYHGFGCTTMKIIQALPWYSVDSSCWGAGFRYGRVNLFDTQHSKLVEVDLRKPQTSYQYASLFREVGFDPTDFAERPRNTRENLCAVAAITFLQIEHWLKKRHGHIEIPEREPA